VAVIFFLFLLFAVALAVAALVAGPALSTPQMGRRTRILLTLLMFFLLVLMPMALYILLGIPPLALV
jgi:uncharacterized membrane protein